MQLGGVLGYKAEGRAKRKAIQFCEEDVGEIDCQVVDVLRGSAKRGQKRKGRPLTYSVWAAE